MAPLYEYECSHDGHTFEVMQKIGESGSAECPDHGTISNKKLVSKIAPPSVQRNNVSLAEFNQMVLGTSTPSTLEDVKTQAREVVKQSGEIISKLKALGGTVDS